MKILGCKISARGAFKRLFDFFHNAKSCEQEEQPLGSILELVKNSSDLVKEIDIRADPGSSQELLITSSSSDNSASSSIENSNIETFLDM